MAGTGWRGKGRIKGSKNRSTILKERVQVEIGKLLTAKMRELQELVCEETIPMARAQSKHAKGVEYMVLRKPDGTFTRATDEKQIVAALASGELAYQIFTQAPNTQAFTALLDRTFGKPAEQVQVTGAEGQPLEIIVKKSW